MAAKPKSYFDGMMKIYNAIPNEHKEAKNAAKAVIEKHLGIVRKPSLKTAAPKKLGK